MNDFLGLIIGYGHLKAVVIDGETNTTVDQSIVQLPDNLFERPMRLTDPAALSSAVAEAVSGLTSPLPRQAYVAVEPVYRKTVTPEYDGDTNLNPKMAAKLSIARELKTDPSAIAANAYTIGDKEVYFGYDINLAYSITEVLLRRGVRVQAVLPLEIAAFNAWQAQSPAKNGILVFIVGSQAHLIGVYQENAVVDSTPLPPEINGITNLLANQIGNIKYDLKGLDNTDDLQVYLYSDHELNIGQELSSLTRLTVNRIQLCIAAGAALEDPRSEKNMLPADLLPRPYDRRIAFGYAWIVVLALFLLLASLKLNMNIASTNQQIKAAEAKLSLYLPYEKAESEARASIGRIRSMLDVLNAAAAKEIHWSEAVPVVISRIPNNGVALKTLKTSYTGGYEFSLTGNTPDTKSLLEVLQALDTPPFSISFRAAKKTSSGGQEFTIGTSYSAPLATKTKKGVSNAN